MMLREAIAACLIACAGSPAAALEVYTKKLLPNGVASSPQLAANAADLIFWREPGQRMLTYWIDRKSFRNPAELEAVETALRTAANDWMDACPECGIRFEPATEERQATFKVLWTNYRALTRSFYPDYVPRKRILIIGELFFTATFKYDQVGMLRHELGHVLGYRHEHLRTSKDEQLKCQWEPDPKSRHALSLTPYDPDSVMHYPCATSKDKAYFRLSPLDIEGHEKLYGPPRAPSVTGAWTRDWQAEPHRPGAQATRRTSPAPYKLPPAAGAAAAQHQPTGAARRAGTAQRRRSGGA